MLFGIQLLSQTILESGEERVKNDILTHNEKGAAQINVSWESLQYTSELMTCT